jgi:hypothetical protein
MIMGLPAGQALTHRYSPRPPPSAASHRRWHTGPTNDSSRSTTPGTASRVIPRFFLSIPARRASGFSIRVAAQSAPVPRL